jgi:hypothetical protein
MIKYDLSKVSAADRAAIESSPKLAAMFSRFPDQLLSIDTDAKTVKGSKLGVKTAILYLAPGSISGVNLCPNAVKAGCLDACLFSAGRGRFKSTYFARLRKTLYYLQYTDQFIAQLKREILAARDKVDDAGYALHVRLNGTSDIVWEKKHPDIFEHCYTVQFYDYTKIPGRKAPANYDLTFSYSKRIEFKRDITKAQKSGDRIAVVFSDRSRIPSQFNGMRVVDGDDTDVRAFDDRGVVVALYAKGNAIHDESGFVVRV